MQQSIINARHIVSQAQAETIHALRRCGLLDKEIADLLGSSVSLPSHVVAGRNVLSAPRQWLLSEIARPWSVRTIALAHLGPSECIYAVPGKTNGSTADELRALQDGPVAAYLLERGEAEAISYARRACAGGMRLVAEILDAQRLATGAGLITTNGLYR